MFEFITAACGGFLAGWISRTLVETRLWFFDDYRRRMGPPKGSNPPAPGCKPAPPAGPPEPPPPPPGMRRQYLYNPATMAECGGPCWEARDPRACNCGALWRDVAARWPTIYIEDYPPGYWDDGIPPNLPRRSDVPLAPEMDPRFGVPWDEGTVQRGHGHGGPSTPKPEIAPPAHLPPRSQGGTPNPPPSKP